MISGLLSIPMPRPADLAPSGSQFVIGPENALARQLLGEAAREGLHYNPIVLCGPAGVGKSALAHLLADRRQQALALSRTILTTAPDLYRSLAHAADTGSVADLRVRYQRCGLLLVDDVQQLVGKSAAQQFLAASLDVLTQRGILVIVTLRDLPTATEGLLPTLASRLSGGLVVPLVSPESLARQEIVRQLAEQFDLRLGDEAIARLAGVHRARARPTTAGQLRHAVMQLASAVQHGGQRIAPSLVAQILAADEPEAKAVARQITSAVAKHFQLPLGELKGKSRRQCVADARGLAMYLCRQLTDATYAEIGRQFGNRDHTTVLHACRKIATLAAADRALARLIDQFTLHVTTAHIAATHTAAAELQK